MEETLEGGRGPPRGCSAVGERGRIIIIIKGYI
jgi:hypothetical protein